jgi:hypothetical protein
MSTPFFDLIEELRSLGGAPKVTYPTGNNSYPQTERTIKARRGTHILALGSAEPDAVRFPSNILTEQVELRSDAQIVEVYRKYEVVPGPAIVGAKDTDWGPATTTKQLVTYGTAAPNTTSTADASVTGDNQVEAALDSTTYANLPGPWLYGFEVDPDTFIVTRVKKRIVANGTQGSIVSAPRVAIAGATVANPTVLTLSAPITDGSSIALKNNELVAISGDSNATPSINGNFPATVIDATHISIPVNVTAVTGSGFGTVGMLAALFSEIQTLNDRQSIEICSQSDTSTLVSKTWDEYIDYPWKESIVGIDGLTDTGASETSLAGGFPIPTQLTWQYGYNVDSEVAIRTRRYTGKTFANTLRTYAYGPIEPDSVLQIRTSSGDIIIEGNSFMTHVALSVGTSTTGTQTSTSESVHFKAVHIEDVLTNGFVTGSTIGASITLKLDASSPSTFTAGATFIASSSVEPGRLGLYIRDTVTVTVPTPFP